MLHVQILVVIGLSWIEDDNKSNLDRNWITKENILMGQTGMGSTNENRHYIVTRLGENPDRGLDLLAGSYLIGGTHRPWSRHGVLDPTNLHWHIYGVILKHNFDWLTRVNVLNSMHHIRKLASRHKNGHCFLDTHATLSGNTMLRDMLSRFCFPQRITHGVRWWQDHTWTLLTTKQKLRDFTSRNGGNNW